MKNQSDEASNSPLALLTGDQALDSQFQVRDVGYSDDVALLELKSHSAESEFERILLGLSEDRLVMMIMEDAFGLRTELRFEQMLRNPPLDDDLFHFEPPPGTDVIGALEMETSP